MDRVVHDMVFLSLDTTGNRICLFLTGIKAKNGPQTTTSRSFDQTSPENNEISAPIKG